MRESVGERFCGPALVGLDDDVEGLDLAFSHVLGQILERDAASLAAVGRFAVQPLAFLGDGATSHPDFQNSFGPYVEAGLVQNQLGADGKPVFAGPNGNGVRGYAALAAVVAAVTAVFTVHFLTRYFKRANLIPFAIYCVLFGLAMVIYNA